MSSQDDEPGNDVNMDTKTSGQEQQQEEQQPEAREGEQGINWSKVPYPPPWLLQTKRLIIRPYHIIDAPRTSALATSAEVANSMSNQFPHPNTLADSEWWINHVAPKSPDTLSAVGSSHFTKPEILHYAICLREAEDGRNVEHEGGVFIGGIGIKERPDVYRRGGELGYWLGREYWGKGYMTEAVQEFVEWLFELDDGLTGVEGEKLLRIDANVFGGNESSVKVLERAGFKVEGRSEDVVWKNGEVRDLIILGLTRRQRDTKAAFRTVQG